MSDHRERQCSNCGSLLHHEDACPTASAQAGTDSVMVPISLVSEAKDCILLAMEFELVDDAMDARCEQAISNLASLIDAAPKAEGADKNAAGPDERKGSEAATLVRAPIDQSQDAGSAAPAEQGAGRELSPAAEVTYSSDKATVLLALEVNMPVGTKLYRLDEADCRCGFPQKRCAALLDSSYGPCLAPLPPDPSRAPDAGIPSVGDIHDAMTEQAKRRTSTENIQDVLFAVAALRARGGRT